MIKRFSFLQQTICILLSAFCILVMAASCTDDESFSTSRTDLLTFTIDTVKMDTVFSRVPAATKSFWIHNNSTNGIRCAKVALEKGNQIGFRVNVDGEYLSSERGYQLNDIEVRKGDSIRVFVELTSPEQGKIEPSLIEDNLVFQLESGAQQRVNLNAWSWDAIKLSNHVVKGTQEFSGERPIVVYGGIKVDSTATLIINEGTTLYFHNGAGIDVYGSLLCNGTAEKNVILRGDRLDRMFDYLPYDLVSGQWKGLHFHSSSFDNSLTYTDIHSAFDGVVCDSSSTKSLKLLVENSTIHNCQGYGLKAENSVIGIQASRISNTLHDCVSLNSGFTEIRNCTLAQFYPFDSNRGMALHFSDEKNDVKNVSYVGTNGLSCFNSIVTGFADDVVLGQMNDTTGTYSYFFANNVLRTPQIKDDSIRFVNNIWEKELEDSLSKVADEWKKSHPTAQSDTLKLPTTGENMFVLVSHDTQHYDFHLDSLACAIGKANAEYLPSCDRDGKRYNPQKPDTGCYSLSTSQKNYTKSYLRRRRF